jgi:hypothetical protein
MNHLLSGYYTMDHGSQVAIALSHTGFSSTPLVSIPEIAGADRFDATGDGDKLFRNGVKKCKTVTEPWTVSDSAQTKEEEHFFYIWQVVFCRAVSDRRFMLAPMRLSAPFRCVCMMLRFRLWAMLTG